MTKSPQHASSPKPARQPPPHPTLPKSRETAPKDDSRSVAGEEDPGSADEELREHRPGRDGM